MQNDGLWFERTGLAAALPAETTALRRLIYRAALTTNGNGVHAGGALQLSRPSLRRSLAISVSPLPRDQLMEGLAGVAAVAVFVTDPEAAGRTDVSLLADLYRLTRAETRLAGGLLEGNDLRQTASELGISYHTARTQAKSIFAKTNTRGQSDLMRLLLKLPSRPVPNLNKAIRSVRPSVVSG